MENITTLGIDIAKNVFQLHGVDKVGKVVLQKRIPRGKPAEFMNNLPPCLVGSRYRWGQKVAQAF